MVFDGIILSIIVGFFRKGSLRPLANLKLKCGWVFPLLLIVQFVFFFFQNRYSWLGQASSYTFMAVYVIGLFFLFINRKNPGFTIIFIGVLLNFIVMAINGGRMPVSAESASVLDPGYIDALKTGLYGKHELLTSHTHLGFLGDIIALSKPYPRTQVISIGDVIMNIGIFLYIQHLMVGNKDNDIYLPLKGGEAQ